MTLLLLGLPLLVMLNLATGSVGIPPQDILDILLGRGTPDEVYARIVLQTRLPQALTAAACGAALSVAGLQMQVLFRNPLAGPSVLGVSSAASLGVAFVLLLSGSVGFPLLSHFGVWGNAALTLSAIGGSLVAMMLILWLSSRVKSNATLLIVGVLMGYIATAIIGILKYFSTEEDIHSFVVWGLGSFSRVSGGQVGVFVGLVTALLPLALLLAKPLNTLLLGERYAANLGLNVSQARRRVILSAGTLTAVATAYCGPVMFLGLAVPHIARGLFRTPDHRILLPATLLCGASLALICNFIARAPWFQGTLPINSVTALIGAPVALWIILKRQTDNRL